MDSPLLAILTAAFNDFNYKFNGKVFNSKSIIVSKIAATATISALTNLMSSTVIRGFATPTTALFYANERYSGINPSANSRSVCYTKTVYCLLYYTKTIFSYYFIKFLFFYKFFIYLFYLFI